MDGGHHLYLAQTGKLRCFGNVAMVVAEVSLVGEDAVVLVGMVLATVMSLVDDGIHIYK